MIRHVYVGGCYGDDGPPEVVAESVEAAMQSLMKGYLPADQYEYDGGEQVRWVCQFVDGWIFRCTATIGTSQLYVERFDVLGESPDPDPDPKVPAKAGKKADVA